MSALLWWILCFLTPGQGNDAIYRFHEAADKVLETLFPDQTLPTLGTLSYRWGSTQPEFEDLEALYAVFEKSTRVVQNASYVVDIGRDNMDSYWFVSLFSQDRAEAFLDFCHERKLLSALVQLNEGSLTFQSVLEKALFQRDIYQAICILHDLCDKGCTPAMESSAAEFMAQMQSLFFKLLMTEEELHQLRAMVPKDIDRSHFKTELDQASDKPYLPERLVKDDSRWYEVPYEEHAPKHFVDFQGRSFVRTFIKMPGKRGEEIPEFWQSVFGVYGKEMNITGRAPVCPPNTETMLVRTFGVFLEDGTYTDSKIPEVVLLRIFKTGEPKLDRTTADFRGTLVYVHAMKRGAILANPKNLGLVRISLDRPSFYGFFSGAPDYRNSYLGALTTVRHKCINCHSPLFHGTPTIFSFARKPPGEGAGLERPKYKYDKMLIYTDKEDFYILNTPQYRDLVAAKGTLPGIP